MPRVALWIAGVTTLAACSILTDFDGYVGEQGERQESGADAGGVADAQEDSADGAAVRFCASLVPTPTFCDDFDGLDGGSTMSDRSRAEATEEDFVSPPRALRITVDPLDSGNTKAAFSFPPLSTSPSRLRCRFDLRVEAAGDGGDGSTGVVQFEFVAGKRSALLEVQIRPTSIAVSEFLDHGDGGTTFVPHEQTPMMWPSKWMRVELILSTDPFQSSLIVNDALLERDRLLDPTWFKGIASVSYGNTFANGTTKTARVMRIDNVVVDVE